MFQYRSREMKMHNEKRNAFSDDQMKKQNAEQLTSFNFQDRESENRLLVLFFLGATRF